DHRSPTRTPSTTHQLRWPQPHNPCSGFGVKAPSLVALYDHSPERWPTRRSSLLGIPIRHRILQNSRAISASSFAWPQHVFLSPEAFTSPEQLAEQITHEMCHCWLYLMEEVAPVQTASERVFRLPSGTSQRDAAEVLGALHVAVTLQILWGAIDAPTSLRQTRIDDLRSYAEGCIALLKGEAHRMLTAGGKSLTGDLATLHHQLTAKAATG
ncbi:MULTISPECIES: HEXXH motif-containing putative peptide modification protein, partial [unclassified Streptomyces]|uniref:aKG-HExxH-type peptide beta-hydroxylase n=1 Tax=unclassified Streptomyces TaxID=2593676 RepID=UPI0019D4332D